MDSTWSYEQAITGSAGSRLGAALALSRDCLFVGSPGTGTVSAYLYDSVTDSWSLVDLGNQSVDRFRHRLGG